MKSCIFAAVIVTSATLFAEVPPRNPFWPQGYEGMRHQITAEPRVKPKPKPTVVRKSEAELKTEANLKKQAEEAAKRADEAAKAREAARRAEEERIWHEAEGSLGFGGTMGYRAAGGNQVTAITINGRIYAPGDFVSCNLGEMRFTWRVESVSLEGIIKLRRVKYGAQKAE